MYCAVVSHQLLLTFNWVTGKTVIACCWARAFVKTFGLKIFVIAPPTLHDDWKQTATEATGLRVDTGKKKKPKQKKTTVGVKDKKTKKSVEKTATGKRKKKSMKVESDSSEEDEEPDELEDDDCDMFIYSWSEKSIQSYKSVINDINDYVVICDEAHNMQAIDSKRTQEALKLMFPKK